MEKAKRNEARVIPGTVLDREKAGGVAGGEFLDKIFFVSDGIMLSTVREITGVDGTTLQNWVKRGWLVNPKNKLYDKEQLARILIINMMKNAVRLSQISFLLRYINGETDTATDDIITESKLYDYICAVLDDGAVEAADISEIIERVTRDYEETQSGAAERLRRALEIIVLTWRASEIKSHAERLLCEIEGGR